MLRSNIRILLVEDNEKMRGMLAAHLRGCGMMVSEAGDGETALNAMVEQQHDAIILDLGLPDMDGLDVLRALRAGRHREAAALILTARDAVGSRVRGLDAGADDYLVKPFDVSELEARLRALLRRPGLRQEDEYVWRDLRFAPASRILQLGSDQAELTPKEAAVFEALIRAGERIVVRDALLERLGTFEDEVTENALEAVISRLRKKAASLGSNWKIQTVRGIGYRLSAE